MYTHMLPSEQTTSLLQIQRSNPFLIQTPYKDSSPLFSFQTSSNGLVISNVIQLKNHDNMLFNSFTQNPKFPSCILIFDYKSRKSISWCYYEFVNYIICINFHVQCHKLTQMACIFKSTITWTKQYKQRKKTSHTQNIMMFHS